MRSPRNTTERNKDDVIARFTAGETGKSIARSLNLDKSAITKRLKVWGISGKSSLAARMSLAGETSMTETDLAYVSGLFDGEGTVCMSIRSCGYAEPQLQLATRISNTHRGVIEQLHQWFGGHVSTKSDKRPQCLPAWEWSLPGIKSGIFLRLIEPYLIIKKAEANAGIIFADTLTWDFRGRRVPEDVAHLRQLCKMGVLQSRAGKSESRVQMVED